MGPGQEPEPAPSPLVPPKAEAEWSALQGALEDAGAVACQTEDPAAWWPDRRQLQTPRTQGAVDACRRCPAAAACLAYALAADERFGIWGGTTPDQRRALGWASDE